jgi:hypothetical protein
MEFKCIHQHVWRIMVSTIDVIVFGLLLIVFNTWRIVKKYKNLSRDEFTGIVPESHCYKYFSYTPWVLFDFDGS